MKTSHWPKLLPVLPALALVIVLESFVSMEVIPRYILPSPSDVLMVFWNDSEILKRAFWDTFFASALGFALACTLGILLGIALSSARWVQQAFYPYAIFFQTVPIIAIAPLLVIWFGFGFSTVVISTMIVAIFPTIAATLAGIQSTQEPLLELFRLYRASPLQTLFKLKLPFAVPQILTGIRISAGLAVIGAIVGEFIAGGGLGGLIDISRTRQRVDIVFACILLASANGLLLVGLVQGLRKYFLRSW